MKKTNISVDKDLKTDEYLKTSLIDIYAAGDDTGYWTEKAYFPSVIC